MPSLSIYFSSHSPAAAPPKEVPPNLLVGRDIREPYMQGVSGSIFQWPPRWRHRSRSWAAALGGLADKRGASERL